MLRAGADEAHAAFGPELRHREAARLDAGHDAVAVALSITLSTVETSSGLSNWPGMPSEIERSAGPTITTSTPLSESSSSARSMAVRVSNCTTRASSDSDAR